MLLRNFVGIVVGNVKKVGVALRLWACWWVKTVSIWSESEVVRMSIGARAHEECHAPWCFWPLSYAFLPFLVTFTVSFFVHENVSLDWIFKHLQIAYPSTEPLGRSLESHCPCFQPFHVRFSSQRTKLPISADLDLDIISADISSTSSVVLGSC